MDFTGWIEGLRREGLRMADVTEQLSPDESVPSCPEWTVRDLLRHTGWVHRWASLMISKGLTEPPSDPKQIVPDGWPADQRLARWFREGHERLVEVLETAPVDLRCWTIMNTPDPRDFWARRQAHETAIHRVDAELAAGSLTGFAPAFAADGIDELIVWFINRPGRAPAAPKDMTLAIRATDVGRAWTATFGPESAYGRRGMHQADCTVSGDASDLYTGLWSRTQEGKLQVEGDRAVLGHWRESSSF